MGAKGSPIRDDMPAEELRRLARREEDRAAAARMQAIAGALEGLSRAEAARLAGMERQALRDAVLRYNAEGLAGLHDRPRPGRRPRLDDEQRATLRQVVLDGPEVEATGLSAWPLAELCRAVERRWGVSYHPGRMSKLVRRLGLSRQKARPTHPKADPMAREAFAKGGCRPPLTRRGRSMPASAWRCGSWTRPDSARRAASAIAGSPAARDRQACATSATPGPTSSPPSGQQPATASLSCCRRSRPRR